MTARHSEVLLTSLIKERNQEMKSVVKLLALSSIIGIVLISGCSRGIAQSAAGHPATDALSDNSPPETEAPQVGMANPAAVYCEEQGGDYDVRSDADGNQYGVCVFDDGSECDGWAFYRGECATEAANAATGGGAEPLESTVGLANPASVHCEEQGGNLDIRTDADGGQYGVCVFADGSECEEWAFFRGECEPSAGIGAPKQIYGWLGSVITPPAGQPIDAYLVLSPKESGNAGLVPLNEEAKNTITYLKDSGRMAHFWGTLNCNVPGFGGCQVEVTRVRPDGPGEPIPTDAVDGWAGTLQSLPAMAQFDDFFVLDDPLFPVRYGIEPADPAIAAQLDALRDTGLSFLVFGDLICGTMDLNGCQILTRRIEAGQDINTMTLPEGTADQGANDWTGFIHSLPQGAQFDDKFERLGFDAGEYGIEGASEAIQERIAALRDSDKQVHIWGKLLANIPDVGGAQIVVTRIEAEPARGAGREIERLPVIVGAVEDWVGVVVANEEAAQIDDYFQMMDQNGSRFGIWGEGEIGEQLEAVRDTGTVIHVWGIIRYNVPDAYNAQIAVERMEIE